MEVQILSRALRSQPMKKETSKQRKRPDWDTYFMEIAHMVATRATCNRGSDLKYAPGFKGVGAVIARDKMILSTGYNGSPRGLKHCDEVGHEMIDGHCVRTVHSEANAIAQAAKNGMGIDGATLFTTASPCYDCFKLLINAGIKRIVYSQYYESRYGMSKPVLQLAKKAGIKIDCLKV
jgi:dCMP deaminase